MVLYQCLKIMKERKMRIKTNEKFAERPKTKK